MEERDSEINCTIQGAERFSQKIMRLLGTRLQCRQLHLL